MMIGETPDCTVDIAASFEQMLPQILVAIRIICKKYRDHHPELEEEEVIQEFVVFLLAHNYRRFRSFRNESSFRTWIAVVAQNFVKDWLASNSKLRGRVTSLAATQPSVAFADAEQTNPWEHIDRRVLLGAAKSRLTARQRQLFDLWVRREASEQEIASRMDISLQSVPKLKSKLVKALRRHLCIRGEQAKKISSKSK